MNLHAAASDMTDPVLPDDLFVSLGRLPNASIPWVVKLPAANPMLPTNHITQRAEGELKIASYRGLPARPNKFRS